MIPSDSSFNIIFSVSLIIINLGNEWGIKQPKDWKNSTRSQQKWTIVSHHQYKNDNIGNNT